MESDKAYFINGRPGWFIVSFTYDEILKDELKELAGSGNYRYNPTQRAWAFKEELFESISDVFNEYEYEIIDGRRTRTAHPQSNTAATVNPWDIIFGQLNQELATALYRAAIKVVHPDNGGSNDTTRLLIEAWQKHKRDDA